MALMSRARLARNLRDFPFPGQASDNHLRLAAQQVRRAALADTERLAELQAVSVAHLSPSDKAALLDARRISPELMNEGAHRYALLDEEGLLSVFVNEEDHVRVHALSPGNDTLTALASSEDAEARLARRLIWAHAERWGHLTTALTNVGTGLRLSVLLHLPALTFLNRAEETLTAARSLDTSVRGAYGEASQAVGDLYQVSNAVTFGLTTRQIAARVQPVVAHLVEAERQARNDVAGHHAERAGKSARESLTVIEKAQRLDAAPCLALLSSLRLAGCADLPDAPQSLRGPAGARLFAVLVADLQMAAPLSASFAPESAAVRLSIARAARLRSALRPSTPRAGNATG